MKYTVHPEAEVELELAANFYRERGGNTLAQSLIAEFEHAIEILLQQPKLGATTRNGRRRYVMRRFSYSLIYQVNGDEIRIFAVAHHRRRPAYWRGRK